MKMKHAFITGLAMVAVTAIFAHDAHADGTDVDWRGHDKIQHMEIGVVTAGSCTALFDKPWQCFAASEAFGLAEQLYAIKTNPSKRKREGAYDLLGHTIGAALGSYGVHQVYVSIGKQSIYASVSKSF